MPSKNNSQPIKVTEGVTPGPLTAAKLILNPLMIGFLRVLPAFGMLAAAVDAGACGFRIVPPTSHFKHVDFQGRVQLVEKISEFDAGDFRFPVYLVFNSGSSEISPHAGASFRLPLLECRMVALDEHTFRFDQPDGWHQIFWRDKKNPNVLLGSDGWKAEIKGNTIQATADCGGTRVTFMQGKPTRLEIGGRVFVYEYTKDRAAKITENGIPVVSLRQVPGSEDEIELTTNLNQRSVLTEGKRARVETINGTKVIGATEKVLSRALCADGSVIEYDFHIDEKLNQRLAVPGRGEFTWNPASGLIESDGAWRYTIRKGDYLYGNAAIERTGKDGAKEFWMMDSTKGFETVIRNGTKTVKTWFTTGRNFRGKVKRIESGPPDGPLHTVFQASYDEFGRLSRANDAGLLTTVTYGADGNVDKITINSESGKDGEKQ